MLRLNLLKPQYLHALPSYRALALSAVSLLVLAGCGGDNGGTVTTSGPNSVSNSSSAPIIAAADSAETVQPLTPADTVKADGVQTAAANAIAPIERISPIPTPMETFRAMAPQQVLKITPLFKEPVSDESARIKRVEDAVQGMHNDFETIMPTMVRMASMEKDMRGLINKLQVLTGDTSSEQSPVKENPGEAEGEPMPLTQELIDPQGAANAAAEADGTAIDDFEEQAIVDAASAPVTVTKTETTTVVTTAKAEPTPAPAPAKIDGAAEVKGIRIADHADSTRIVLDMSAKAAIPPGNFQNDNKQLVLDLPQINWTAKTEAQLKNSGLVTGYLYENGKLTLNLARPAEIKGQQSLPPEGSSGYRFVLDLKTRT